jgi:peptidoglycan L-alanyl-D-glutamate endopeptidase CwlK
MMILSAGSVAHLAGVHPALARVVRTAAQITVQDFQISEGIRSDADQLKVWLRHASKLNGIPAGQTINGIVGTGRGNHQLQPDGLGHAVDAVPYVGGLILWSLKASDAAKWGFVYAVADAMRRAAISEKVRLRWGACWDRCLNDLPDPGTAGIAAAVAAYEIRHAGPDFLDGPHFELEKVWDSSNFSAPPAIS